MYTSLELVRAELRQDNRKQVADDTYDERFIVDRIDDVVRAIDQRLCGRFAPFWALTAYDTDDFTQGGLMDLNTLWLGYDLLEVISVSNNGTPVDSADYSLWPVGTPRTRLKHVTGWSEGTITVNGIWGYPGIWQNSYDTLQADVDDTERVLTIEDADGEDVYFNTPRFSPGQLIRLDDECMLVKKVDTTTEKLSVLRGVNGSTKAGHVTDAVISIWEPDAAIQHAATRWVAYMYSHRAQFAKTEVEGMQAVEWPKDMPTDVEADLLRIGQRSGNVRDLL